MKKIKDEWLKANIETMEMYNVQVQRLAEKKLPHLDHLLALAGRLLLLTNVMASSLYGRLFDPGVIEPGSEVEKIFKELETLGKKKTELKSHGRRGFN